MVVTTIITFIIIFSLLIFLHELGHFITARKFGVRVDEFGFGLPPRMIGWHRAEGRWKRFREGDTAQGTIYSLNWIPFGGFVKLYGEEGEMSNAPDSFSAKGKLPRAIILSAGVAMNVLFAAALLSAGFMTGMPSVIDEQAPAHALVRDPRVQVVDIVRNSPAENAGIQIGDVLVAFNSEPVDSVAQFQSRTQEFSDTPFTLTLENEEKGRHEVTLAAEKLPAGEGRAVIGVGLIRTGTISYPWYRAIPEGVRATGELSAALLKTFGTIIVNLARTGHSGATVAGPVGIAVLTGHVVNLGWVYVLQFAATLSLNLAIINYFPFPALDGGRVLFIAIEALRGRAVSKKLEAGFHTVGFALLIMLIMFITYKDIARYGLSILETVKRVFMG